MIRTPSGIESIVVDEKTIARRVGELATRIASDLEATEVTVICVLTGAIVFTADLVRKLPFPVRIDCIRLESYGQGTRADRLPRLSASLKGGISDQHVLVIDDILDTGRTLSALADRLKKMGPASVKTCVLLDKPSRRQVDFEADYVGFEIPDEFVVGYGLDFAERFRNLPYIGSLSQDETQPK